MKAQCPSGSICLQTAGKILQSRGLESGEKKIFEQLRGLGFMAGKHAGSEALKRGWLKEEIGDFRYGNTDDVYTRVFITPRGLAEIERRLRASRIHWRPKLETGLQECKLGF